MDNINVFNFTCLGAGHKDLGLPCQDRSFSESMSANGRCSLAIVSDGHGGRRYFRSDRGAEYAVQVAADAIRAFVQLFTPATDPRMVARGKSGVTDTGSPDYTEPCDVWEPAFRHLFKRIRADWLELVLLDWTLYPPTPEEMPEGVCPDSYADYPEEAYGCTLMASFRTESFWAAFQLGDGRIVAVWPDGKSTEPVPWDSACLGNLTTSLCTHTGQDFRYCYGTKMPAAVFLGSDGMDDSFSSLADLEAFYGGVAKMMASDGAVKTGEAIRDYLPRLSARASRDDMSLAFWYDTALLHSLEMAEKRKTLLGMLEDLLSKIRKAMAALECLDGVQSQQDDNQECREEDGDTAVDTDNKPQETEEGNENIVQQAL